MSRIVFVFLCACTIALAQTSTSEITGTVRDSTGAVVPGANVTATNEATGVGHSQTTTNAGLYAFPALPAGSYTIAVEITGFKTNKKTGNLLGVWAPLTLYIRLTMCLATDILSLGFTATARH